MKSVLLVDIHGSRTNESIRGTDSCVNVQLLCTRCGNKRECSKIVNGEKEEQKFCLKLKKSANKTHGVINPVYVNSVLSKDVLKNAINSTTQSGQPPWNVK